MASVEQNYGVIRIEEGLSVFPYKVWLLMNRVMVNFMCLPDWAIGWPDTWLNITSEYVCERSWMRLTFDWMPQSEWASLNLLKAWTQYKRLSKKIFFLCILFVILCFLLYVTLHFIFIFIFVFIFYFPQADISLLLELGFLLEVHTGSPASRPLDSDWNYTIGSALLCLDRLAFIITWATFL